jgi:hypothetical protein
MRKKIKIPLAEEQLVLMMIRPRPVRATFSWLRIMMLSAHAKLR